VNRDLARLSSERFDLLVLGGGIYGLIAAYDASQRGLSVALVERGDFAGATSFNHLKTLHGGIRYLQRLDVRRMRESTRERRAFARIAPHLIGPLGFVMPLYGGPIRNPAVMTAALLANAALSYDRNRGVPPTHTLPVGRVLSAKECLAVFPGARPGVRSGLLWYDYQMHHADRLALSFALAASEAGAALANYVEATDLQRDGTRIVGARVRDAIGAQRFDIRAAVTLNAAGPWTLAWLARAGVQRSVPLFRNLNVVTTRPAKGVALVAPTAEGRAFVAAPWRGRTMIGTYEAARTCGADDTAVPEEELADFLDQIAAAFPDMRLTREELTLVHRGVVPAEAGRDGRPVLKRHYEIWDHGRDGAPGLVSMLGVKYTTARRVAELAVDLAVRHLGRQTRPCATADRPLPGGDVPDVDVLVAHTVRDSGMNDHIARHLVSAHGSNVQAILDLIRREPHLGSRVADGRPVLKAEVVHAVRHEMAIRLIDVVARRTTLGSARHPGAETVRTCAELMRLERGWTASAAEDEIRAVDEFYAPIRPRG
jgi:glycerol-3-phosphate dehydrogenase